MSDKTKATAIKEEIAETEATVAEESPEMIELKEKLAKAEAELQEMKARAEAPTVDVVEDKPQNIDVYLNEKVPFYAFRDNDKYKDDIHVGVNGYNYVIQRGVTVMIPRFVKNILEDAERQNNEASRHSQNLIDQFELDSRRRNIDT